MHRLARGIDDRPVAERAVAKQISAESTFAVDLTTLEELRDAIAPIAEHAHQRLCRDGRGARLGVRRGVLGVVGAPEDDGAIGVAVEERDRHLPPDAGEDHRAAEAEPQYLIPVAARTRGPGAELIQQAAQHLYTCEPPLRSCYLELLARQSGFDELAARAAAFPGWRPWQAAWARYQVTQASYRVIGRLSGEPCDGAVARVDGEPAAVALDAGGALQAWSLESGAPLGPELVVTGQRPAAMALLTVAGRCRSLPRSIM